MKLHLIWLLFISVNSFPFEILPHLQNIDTIDFGSIIFDIDLTDSEMVNLVTIASNENLLVSTNYEEFDCSHNTLIIVNEKKFTKLKKERNPNFVKNPCKTFLVIFQETIEFLDVENEPYFFGLKYEKFKIDLYEIQIYSKRIISLIHFNGSKIIKENQDIIKRRSNFNGGKIRLVRDPSLDFSYNALPWIQKNFNFTIDEKTFEGYGSLRNGSWKGSIRQIIDKEIDMIAIGTMTQNLDRISVCTPGFGLAKAKRYFYFSRKAYEITSPWAIFEVFNGNSWTFIGLTFVFMVVILSSGSNIIKSFASVMKAFVGDSFNQDLFLQNNFKRSKSIQIFVISLFGSFIFWCFTGILISLLAVPVQQAPLKSYDDILTKSKNFKLVTVAHGSTDTALKNWIGNDPREHS